MKNQMKYKTTKNKIKKSNLKKGTKKRQHGGKLCNRKLYDNDNNDIYSKGNEIFSSTNKIYEDKNNSNILIKQIGPEYNFFNFLSRKIDNEAKAAKIAYELDIGPKIFYSTICIDPTDYEKIIGYIVMDKIIGKPLSTESEIDMYIDEIFNKINLLYKNNIYYNDFQVNNFIIENRTKKLYIIDYGEICDPDETYCEILSKNEIKKRLYLSLNTISF